jgi:GT2 family glycosyltransferase
VRFLEAALGSVLRAASQSPGTEVIAVDHRSADGSSELLQASFGPHCRIVPVDAGTPAAVRNAGVAAASGTVLCFVDADVVIEPGYVARALEILDRTGAAATGCTVRVPATDSWIARVWDQLHRPTGDGWRAWLASANLVVRRDAFVRVGGFDPELETGEDAELCQRLRAAGHRIYESAALDALHLDNPGSLGAFFRKEAWRALGMLGTARRSPVDRPTLMMLVHLVCLCLAGSLLVRWGLSFVSSVLAFALVFAVPAVTVVYRCAAGRRLVEPLRPLLLYQLYYLARLRALLQLIFRWARGQWRV